MMWIGFAILICYCCAIIAFAIGFRRIPETAIEHTPAEVQFSIVIPFRNEANNLSSLLQSIQQLNYPSTHFEVLFVNDESTDISEEIIHTTLKDSNLVYQILQNNPATRSPKKTAITLAVKHASYAWIITTDADCTVPANWLQALNETILKTNPVCVAMPVDYHVKNSFLHRYQQLDNWSLQAITMGSFGLAIPLLNNGANFAYQKEAFYKVDAFKGNAHIASGDDIFLLEKFKHHFSENIAYLKSADAIVSTIPVSSWKQLLSQRVRWASKTSKQRSLTPKLIGLLVFLTNLLTVAALVLPFFFPDDLFFALAFVIIKLCIDFLLLQKTAHLFKKPFPYLAFVASVLPYAILTILVVFLSLAGNYSWKERTFNTKLR